MSYRDQANVGDTRVGKIDTMSIPELRGKQYHANNGRLVTVLGPDPLMPDSKVLLEDENGKQWGCLAHFVRRAVENEETTDIRQ